MKARDLVDNYLIGLGVSLGKGYVYIPDSGYEYSNKSGKTEVVRLGKHDVKMNKLIRNAREILRITSIARNNFLDTVTVSNDIGKSCEKIMGHAVLYYAEFVKYIANKIDIKAEVAEKLMTLSTTAMDNAAREIDKVIDKFNIDMDKARQEGEWHRRELTASAIAEANTVRGYHVTGYEREGLFGDTLTIYASPITASTAKRNQLLTNAGGAANLIQSVYEESANEKAVESLDKVRSIIIDDFNKRFKELLSVILDEYFVDGLLYKLGDNIEDNPCVYGYYLDIVDELSDDQLEDYKKVVEYYDVKIYSDLKKRVEDNMFREFTKNGVVDYNEIDYKAYVCLKGDEFGPGSNLCKRIHHYYEIDFNPNVSFKENMKYVKKYDSYRERVNNCKYIGEQERKDIIKNFDDYKTNTYKNRNNNIINGILTIIVIILGILALIIGGKYTYLYGVYDSKVYLFGIGGIVLGIVLTLVTFYLPKKLPKKILQGLLIVAFMLVPIMFSGAVAAEEEKREGKHVIQLEILDEKQVLLLAEGERIPLDPVVKEGYVFNGWLDVTSSSEGCYNFREVLVGNNAKYKADLYSTAETLTTVTFVFDNGQPNVVIQLPLYAEIPDLETPEKEGYRFAGWQDQVIYKTQYSDLKVEYDHPVYKAIWE